MQGDEARLLLGFPPNSRPTLSQRLKQHTEREYGNLILTSFLFMKSPVPSPSLS
ncbi:hypothetical protein OIU78_011249, partial [Salix suchowensis]